VAERHRRGQAPAAALAGSTSASRSTRPPSSRKVVRPENTPARSSPLASSEPRQAPMWKSASSALRLRAFLGSTGSPASPSAGAVTAGSVDGVDSSGGASWADAIVGTSKRVATDRRVSIIV
jgi:hypothetical protein